MRGGGIKHLSVSYTASTSVAAHNTETFNISLTSEPIPSGYSVEAVRFILCGSTASLRKKFQITIAAIDNTRVALYVSNISDSAATADTITFGLTLVKSDYIE